MNVLAFDCGNTRLKWGMFQGDGWTHVGTVARDELAGLGATLASLPRPDRIAVANVAGAGMRAALEAQLAAQYGAQPAGSDRSKQGLDRAKHDGAAQPLWLTSQREQCGIVNLYGAPATLGVDRWCALIGARRYEPGACVVVGAGTATTVDLLSAQGEFLGGLILPGIDLMKRSLAENTAGLPLGDGRYLDEPRSTVDAIESGVMHAQAGAVERMAGRMARRLGMPGDVPCLVSGGSAVRLGHALAIPHRVLDHLVLEGVARIALSNAAPGGS